VAHRNMIVTLKHPKSGEIRLAGNPVKMSATAQQPYEYPPTLGQHTREILNSILGYSDERISELVRDQVVA